MLDLAYKWVDPPTPTRISAVVVIEKQPIYFALKKIITPKFYKNKTPKMVHNNWIKSITGISSPHNGTTLSDIVTSGIPFLQDFIAVAAVTGNSFYSFDCLIADGSRVHYQNPTLITKSGIYGQ